MRTRLAIAIQPGDRARPNQLEDALGLVDGRALDDPDWHRPFGRIRGNDFTLEDAELAIANIRALAEVRMKAPAPFDDPETAKTWVTGRDQAARQAIELAEGFLEDLREDLVETMKAAR